MLYEFTFWKEWCDAEGRLWGEPHVFDSVTDARKSHAGALTWHWCGKDISRPSVSDLISVSFREDPATGKKREESRIRIADGGLRGFYEATLSGVRPSGGGNTVQPARSPVRAGAEQDSNDTPF